MLTNLSSAVADTAQTVGKQTVLQGDCLAVLQRLRTASVDLIVTSPPYNIGVAYKSYDDNRPRAAYLSWLKKVSKQLDRVLKLDGSFFLNVGSTNADPWMSMDLAGAFRKDFVLQNHIAWAKSLSIREDSHGHFKPIKSHRFLNQNHESIFHFTKTGAVPVDRLAIGVPFKDKTNIARWGHAADKRCGGNVWFIPYKTVKSKAQKFDHPAGYPVDLPMRCMLLHGKADMVVLDPFVGAGTTLVAAERLGHSGFGIDVEPEYVATSVARLEAETSNAARLSDSGRSRTLVGQVADGVENYAAGCLS